MSAKFLNVFSDENPELQKQIGCMTGIFQMFDQRHLLAGRRLNQKRIASGHFRSKGSSQIAGHNGCSPQIVLEKNFSKSTSENQRVSMESSRTSFSSSSCSSSFSSLDYSRSTQQDPPSLSFERTIYLEKSFQNTPKPINLDVDAKTVRHDPNIGSPHASPAQTGRQSLDFRDFVKDSINRETRSLSIKTSSKKEEVKKNNNALKRQDSPRPMQLYKSPDGSSVIGIDGKSRMRGENFTESLSVLTKLKEAPWQFAGAKEAPRSSCEGQDAAALYTLSRDSPRFSYDGRDIQPRTSVDSRENGKLASRLKELPRLSLDSREGSARNSNLVSKLNSILKDADNSSSVSQKVPTPVNLQQESVIQQRPPSVVAKLMGLEALPSMSKDSQEPTGLSMTSNSKDCYPFRGQRSSEKKPVQDGKQERSSQSPKRVTKDPVSPRLRNLDPMTKPMSTTKVPIETAPWKQQEKVRVPRKATYGYQEASLKPSTETVYSGIEKRLKELEFQQSNKDLRALKQILDAMQAKGLLETKRVEEQQTQIAAQKIYNSQTPANAISLARRSTAPRSFQSPIVIMKPAKSMNRSGVLASSAVSLEGLSGLPKLRTGNSIDKKKSSLTGRTGKKSDHREEENSLQKTQTRTTQSSSGRQMSQRENGSSMKNSNLSSPRLQQRKAEAEKQLRPPTPPNSNKAQRQSVNKQQQLESVSPGGRLRRKPTQVQQNDDQLSEVSSDTRNLSHQGDDISQRSDSNISLASQVDVEVTSADRSAGMNITYQQGRQSPSRKAGNNAASVMKPKNSSFDSKKDASTLELAAIVPEQPSPISVLDASFYQDDMPPSPVKKISAAFKDNKNGSTAAEISPPKLSSGINHKKLESIESLVQKLRALSSADDETQTTDHIASLCETQNPDHRYVSEILLASGLLMKDLSSGPMDSIPTHPHPSVKPINPDLFLVLEQTKSGLLPKLEPLYEGTLRPKIDREKLHRKLVFDVVNELLSQKLELTSLRSLPSILLQNKRLCNRIPAGQHLLKELCSEIDKLQADSLISSELDDCNLVSAEDILRRSQPWEDFGKEIPALVLEIERSIFKDLIDEVVSCEAKTVSQAKTYRRRRQLFPK